MSTKENHQNKRFDYQAELQYIGQQYHTSNDDNEDKIIARIAKVQRPINKEVMCSCPGSEPGIVNVDPMAHLPGCRFRKKSQSKRYTVDTSVTPNDFKDGYSLGVALTS